MPQRTPTSTSSFGAGRREGHDASAFYARFTAPEISADDTIHVAAPANPFVCADAAHMDDLPDNSVALVVTSPPYFVGKEYEQALGEGHVPATYLDYLDMLARVFAECKRVLEPGGRIAVNVANLGRRPYRSLSADVIRILQDDLGLLLRGEVIWVKGKGASGSCAWGSFRQATNPVLRDLTERIIIASKGRFDRARPPKQRQVEGLPYESSAGADEFMEATLDVWELPAERATRVGHPAPFPVGLPLRLIELYTFKGDLVLDPFMGSGSTLVAAARAGRRYIGYDVDPHYVEIARARVAAAVAGGAGGAKPDPTTLGDRGRSYGCKADLRRLGQPAQAGFADVAAVSTAVDGGAQPHPTARVFAERLLSDCGFNITARNQSVKRLGLDVDFVAEDSRGRRWHFLLCGAFTISDAGLQGAEALWKALGRALLLARQPTQPARVVLLATGLPHAGSPGDAALRAAGPSVIFDVVALRSGDDRERLRQYATGEVEQPLAGFWGPEDL